jgi:hypothetical protein
MLIHNKYQIYIMCFQYIFDLEFDRWSLCTENHMLEEVNFLVEFQLYWESCLNKWIDIIIVLYKLFYNQVNLESNRITNYFKIW